MVSAKAIFPLAVALFSSAAVLQGCGGGGDKPKPAGPKTIVGLAEATPTLSTLVTALKLADPAVLKTLEGTGPFTVFAPTDTAFSELPKPLFTYLTHTQDTLTTVLEYHVTNGAVKSSDLTDGEKVKMLAGGDVTIAINKVGNETFVKVNDATVATPNVEASNGIVHIIDKVLVPPSFKPADFNIVSTAVTSGLATLAAAVTAANLTDTLSGAGPFTVFAPNDDAFKALPAGVLEALLKPENKQALAKVLTYHVASGELLAGDLTNGQKITTVETQDVVITIDGKNVSVSGANVVKPNVFATNGVVHVIDKVLQYPGFVPPSSSIEATAATEQKATKAVVV